MKVKIFVVVVMLAVATLSCTTKQFYEDFYAIGSKGWDTDSTARFNFTVPDNKSVYDIVIATRNLESYEYNNLWLTVRIQSPDKSAIRDTIEIQLAQPNGKWIGKGTSGVYYNEYEFKNNVYFPNAGEYSIAIRHAMRPNNLMGLKDVGIRIIKR